MRARRAPLVHLVAAAAALVVCAAFAWPAVSHLASRMWGDTGDAWQNWWNGWWMARALAEGRSPMFTRMLWWPTGVSLWLHTFGPLNAALTAFGQRLLPGFAGYNALVLAHLAFGCFGGFVLFRGILLRAVARGALPRALPPWAVPVAAFAGGLAFGLSPYTWAHVSVHLHLTSLGFVALFAHALLTTADRRGAWWPVAAGVLVLATALCGVYLVVDEAIIGAAIAIAVLARVRRDGWRPLVRVGIAGAVSGLLLLPVLLPTVHVLGQPLLGTHDPSVFSADLLSLVVPAPMTALGAHFWAITGRFSGNAAENAGYLGYAALALLLLALVTVRARGLGALLLAGALGLVLSLGPLLHVGGVVHRGVTLPYRWLATLVPLVNGLGCPVRFGLPMNLALGAGVALGGAWIAGRLARRAAPTYVVLLAILVPCALVLAEYAPAGQRSSRYPAPGWMRALARDHRRFAVADLTGWTHPLYDQTLHAHPIVHGYLSRRPKKLVDALLADPVLGPIYGQVLYRRASPRLALTRVDPRIDFDWGAGAPAPNVGTDFFVTWTGTLVAPTAGRYRMTLGSDDGSSLFIDRRRVVDDSGVHPYREASATVALTAGPHRVTLRFRDVAGLARMVWRWQPPGGAVAVVPTSALRTPDGRPGLLGRYGDREARTTLSPAAARAHLLDVWQIRYFIAYASQTPWLVSHGLGLTRMAASDGLVMYEVRRAGAPEP